MPSMYGITNVWSFHEHFRIPTFHFGLVSDQHTKDLNHFETVSFIVSILISSLPPPTPRPKNHIWKWTSWVSASDIPAILLKQNILLQQTNGRLGIEVGLGLLYIPITKLKCDSLFLCCKDWCEANKRLAWATASGSRTSGFNESSYGKTRAMQSFTGHGSRKQTNKKTQYCPQTPQFISKTADNWTSGGSKCDFNLNYTKQCNLGPKSISRRRWIAFKSFEKIVLLIPWWLDLWKSNIFPHKGF